MSDSIYIIQAFQKGITPTKMTTFCIFNMDSYSSVRVHSTMKNKIYQTFANYAKKNLEFYK